MLIRFSFVNQYNPLEEDLLYIFNPLEFRTHTDGLLCGISSADLMPCAFKCLVALEKHELNEIQDINEFYDRFKVELEITIDKVAEIIDLASIEKYK